MNLAGIEGGPLENIRIFCVSLCWKNYGKMKISEAIFAGSSARVSQKPKRKLPEFAFIGRSNVGKSSLINMLTGNGKLAMTSSTPGKTKVINHFLINDSWYLVDLPGYGYAKLPGKMRDELVAVIRDYIHNSEEMAILFVLAFLAPSSTPRRTKSDRWRSNGRLKRIALSCRAAGKSFPLCSAAVPPPERDGTRYLIL